MTGSDGSDGNALAPGWYPDPSGRFELRYHNGVAWTGDVATDGRRYVDPRTGPPGGSPVSDPAPPDATAPQDATASPGANASPTPSPQNGIGVAAMVLGIIALAVGWLPYLFVVGAIAAVLAIVFGWIGLRRARTTAGPTGPSVTGLITGVTGIAAVALGAVLTVVVTDALDDFENPEPHTIDITSCDVDDGSARVAGLLTNTGDSTGSYSIELAFVRPATDNAQRSGRVDVDDLGPGDSTTFELVRAVQLDDVECRVVSVDGPLPFGLDLGL